MPEGILRIHTIEALIVMVNFLATEISRVITGALSSCDIEHHLLLYQRNSSPSSAEYLASHLRRVRSGVCLPQIATCANSNRLHPRFPLKRTGKLSSTSRLSNANRLENLTASKHHMLYRAREPQWQLVRCASIDCHMHSIHRKGGSLETLRSGSKFHNAESRPS